MNENRTEDWATGVLMGIVIVAFIAGCFVFGWWMYNWTTHTLAFVAATILIINVIVGGIAGAVRGAKKEK